MGVGDGVIVSVGVSVFVGSGVVEALGVGVGVPVLVTVGVLVGDGVAVSVELVTRSSSIVYPSDGTEKLS